MTSLTKKVTELGYQSVHRMGIWQIKQKLFPKFLTVLNYHRIGEVDSSSSNIFKPNISANQAVFSAQMDYLAENYNVVSLQEVANWLNKGALLPDNPALITFDDGYFDNYEKAYPILREQNFCAVIFLTTGFIDRELVFYWDLIAYCIYQTKLHSIDLDGMGNYTWRNGREKDLIVLQIVEDLKKLPNVARESIVQSIPEKLDIQILEDTFHNFAMTWDQIREMKENNIDFGAHTVNHPILTRVPLEKAKYEIVQSKRRIEEELGSEVISFAYPNGQPGDFSLEVIGAVKESGFDLAFSLVSGPSSFAEVRKEQFQIRRIFLSHKDTIPRFAAKLNGISRL